MTRCCSWDYDGDGNCPRHPAGTYGGAAGGGKVERLARDYARFYGTSVEYARNQIRRAWITEPPRWDPEDVGPLDADDIIRKAGDLAYVVTDPYRSRRANFRFVMHPETLGAIRRSDRQYVIAAPVGPVDWTTDAHGHYIDPPRFTTRSAVDVSARRVFGLPVRVDVETRPGVVVLETYTERDTNNHHPEAR